MEKNQKGSILITILILILTAIAAGGFYFYNQNKSSTLQQTPQTTDRSVSLTTPSPIITDETSNWKTFTNNQFSFKYPEEKYFLDQNTTPADNVIEGLTSTHIWFCPTKIAEDCAFQTNIFQVMVYDNPKDKSLQEWLDSSEISPFRTSEPKACFFKDSRTQEVNSKFLGFESKFYRYIIDAQIANNACKDIPLEGGGVFQHNFFEKDGKIYDVAVVMANESNVTELEKILSTFKFIE